jgi:hypothetical protein
LKERCYDAMEISYSGHSNKSHGEYLNETGDATAENEEGIDYHLLHGDRSAPGLHHGFGIKALDIDIVPEEDDDRRRRKRRSR